MSTCFNRNYQLLIFFILSLVIGYSIYRYFDGQPTVRENEETMKVEESSAIELGMAISEAKKVIAKHAQETELHLSEATIHFTPYHCGRITIRAKSDTYYLLNYAEFKISSIEAITDEQLNTSKSMRGIKLLEHFRFEGDRVIESEIKAKDITPLTDEEFKAELKKLKKRYELLAPIDRIEEIVINEEERIFDKKAFIKISDEELETAKKYLLAARLRSFDRVNKGKIGRANITITPLWLKFKSDDKWNTTTFDVKMNSPSKGYFFSKPEAEWFLRLYRKYSLMRN